MPPGRKLPASVSNRESAKARSSRAVNLTDDTGPLLDGLPSVAHSLGERFFFFIIVAPLPVVVHLDEMRQRPPGAEQLPLGIAALGLNGQGFGHDPGL